MRLEFHQLDRRWERLRAQHPARQRRLLASLAEAGQLKLEARLNQLQAMFGPDVDAALVFEDQLDRLGEALISGKLLDRRCTLFDRQIGRPLSADDDSPWCGAGNMIAVGPEGSFYPCARFMEGALAKRKPRILGDVEPPGLRVVVVRADHANLASG